MQMSKVLIQIKSWFDMKNVIFEQINGDSEQHHLPYTQTKRLGISARLVLA